LGRAGLQTKSRVIFGFFPSTLKKKPRSRYFEIAHTRFVYQKSKITELITPPPVQTLANSPVWALQKNNRAILGPDLGFQLRDMSKDTRVPHDPIFCSWIIAPVRDLAPEMTL